MDVQAELAKAVKAQHKKVYGIETQPPSPEKTKQKENHTQQPVTTNVGRSSKNAAHKAAADAIAAKMGKPAQSNLEKSKKKDCKVPFSNGSSGGSSRSLGEGDKKTVKGYQKMIKMGLSEGAVRHKMDADGISKHIINAVFSQDETGTSSTASRSRAVTVVNQNRTGSLSPEEEKIADQYRKMKKIRMPDEAIKHKLIADGVSVKIQEAVFAGDSFSSSSRKNSGNTTAGTVSSLSQKDETIAAPYRKMIKTRLPEGAVIHKMTIDGIEMHIQDSVLKGETPRNKIGPTIATTNTIAGTVASLSQKDETIAAPYRKMIKTRLPEGAVIHKMSIDGIEMHIQDSVLKGETPRNKIGPTTATTNTIAGNVSSLSQKDETTATPYRKMIKTRLPKGAVIHKMTIDGVEMHIQDSVLKGETPSNDLSTVDTSNTRPLNPMAAAIKSGGIGALKKGTTNETGSQHSRSSNPLAAAIALSGGIGALKKTSIQTKEIASGRPSNPLAAAIAASGGQGALKKTSVNNNQQSPKPRSSGNSLVDELAAKGFQSNLKKTPSRAQQPPQANTGYNNLTNKVAAKDLNLGENPSKTIQSSIMKSSSDEELRESIEERKGTHAAAVNTISTVSPKMDAPKPSTMNKNMSSGGNQPSTMIEELHEQSQSASNSKITNESKISVPENHPTSTKMNASQSLKPLPSHPQAQTQAPVQKPDSVVIELQKPAGVAVSAKPNPEVYIPAKPKSQKPDVYVPPQPKSAKILNQKSEVYIPPKPIPMPLSKANNQTKVDAKIAPEMRINNAKQSAKAINSSEDGGTQQKERKKKVKNSNMKKKPAVRDDGVEQHCQCIVM